LTGNKDLLNHNFLRHIFWVESLLLQPMDIIHSHERYRIDSLMLIEQEQFRMRIQLLKLNRQEEKVMMYLKRKEFK
jgi:hypothetical protein